jgi:hypothetical protein
MATETSAKLEKLLPLPQAAQRLGLTLDALTRLVDSGTIKANVHRGVVLIPESEVKQTITREQFAELKGTPITMAEASKKYSVPYSTLIGWVHNKLGIITIIKSGYGMQIDEADVAYCAAVYKARGRSSRLFDQAGRPYQLKRPEVAAYRQRKAKKSLAHA